MEKFRVVVTDERHASYDIERKILEEAGADDVPGAAGAEAAERAAQAAGAVQTADGAGHGGVLRLPDGNRGQAAAGSPVLL